MSMESDFAFYCPRCQHGHCRPGRATFVRLHGGMVVSAPDTPAYVCDVCAYTEFEREAVRQLNKLLGQSGTPPETEGGSASHYPVDDPGEPGDRQHPKT